MQKKVFLILCGITLFLITVASFQEKLVTFFMPEKNIAPLIKGTFELQDIDKKIVKDTDFRGSYMLVYFGYAFCPDICPTALENITAALEELPKEILDKVTPIFITIDPTRDTPEFLEKYKTSYHPKFLMLWGDPIQTENAIANYRVHAQKIVSVPGASEYLIDHSSIIYLMGKRGELLANFSHGTSPKNMIQKIKEIIR